MRTIATLIVATALCSGCWAAKMKVVIDPETQITTVTLQEGNGLRISQSSQTATYNTETKMLVLSQVSVVEKVSEDGRKMWAKLMEVAGYALGATVVASTAGLPTTPMAVAGGVIALTKQSLADPDPIPEPLPPDDDPEEEVPEKVE